MEPQVFDTIVIGAGAAGITAAIYAVRKNLKVLVLTKNIGGQAALSGDIENYPGFSLISGTETFFSLSSNIILSMPNAHPAAGVFEPPKSSTNLS